LEYSFEVWDNCWQVNSDRLEKLQLEAARIVTALTCYTSLDSIYRKTGWEKVSTRREVKKLCMFYKLNVGNSPEFLCYKERYKIYLGASNLLQYNKKCSAFSVEYPQEQDGL
jgi:hypothetical protein